MPGRRKANSKGPLARKALQTNDKLEALEPFREDGTEQLLTTNQAVRINDNQNSLKAGGRGPSLLEDFILREKITHFDHERIRNGWSMRGARPRMGTFRSTNRSPGTLASISTPPPATNG